MPKTLEMVKVICMDTDLLKGSHTQMHVHTCYKRGRTKCRFGASFMPSRETKVVVPFPPTEDENEKARRQHLRKSSESGVYATVRSLQEDARAEVCKRIQLLDGKVLDFYMDLQVIIDHYACATYVTDYVKADRGMSNLNTAAQCRVPRD
ncbi:hypothetical protein HPB52_004624 [Rhipicephalus sanguineus]|uniref:Uncharacterized protein n=1 Tax=Rhipicephalus sanguineus TaxID=34632 RepID=A0A9D4T5E7_RHISA|nr:hypothetical protein HPB52_004624 [Rhipicephalus sanguineus]